MDEKKDQMEKNKVASAVNNNDESVQPYDLSEATPGRMKKSGGKQRDLLTNYDTL